MTIDPFADIEIPDLEITEGWSVSEVATLQDCEDAHNYLVGAIAGIEYQIDAEGFKPLAEQRGEWVARAKSALRYKKAALNIVQNKRGTLNEQRREAGLLAFIRSVVPPEQWLAWVTAHSAAPLPTAKAA